MVYSKNHNPWISSDLVTVAIMDNFETIYSEASSYLAAHNHDDLYPTRAELEAAYWYAGNDGSGSGSDADLIYKSTGNLHASSFAGLGVPTGLIVLWYGSTGSVPTGWHLCDGTEGTRDLRGKFVVGAGTGSSYSVGDTGGSSTLTASGSISVSNHTLTTAEMAAHTHPYGDRQGTIMGGTYTCGTYYGGGACAYNDWTRRTGTTASAGGGQGHGHSTAEGTSFTGDAVACLPFYYALCYIQKV